METLKLGIDGLDDIEQIGAGGSSRVYRAKQVELDRQVALKVLKASDDPEVARRFDRERKAMGRLSLNEGIVPVYSSGITDRGEPYLIMPYYPNGSLQDRIESGPVPWEEAVGYIASAAETMAAAHEAGVVHLDLKPANILLSSRGEPRIADFGIAKLMSEQTASSNTGPAFTPTFTAPETLLGGQASPASDVYGLAATLWSLIAGRPPFRAIDGADNTLMAVVGRVVHQPAGDLRPAAPDPICSIIEIAMAKDPSDRYPTAGAFKQALATAVANARNGTSATTVAAVPGAASGTPAGNAGSSAGADMGVAGAAQGAPSGAVASDAATAAHSSLQFDAAVPPRLVPAQNARSAGFTDLVDRYSGVIMGLGVAALLLIAVFLGQRLLGSADTNSATANTTQIIDAGDSTSSTARSAQAGAGAGDDAQEPAGPTTTSTTALSTTAATAAPASATTTPSSATTESSTTTTEESTSSTEDPSSTLEPTTSSSETTTPSSSETTTDPTVSSSSSSSETTETTGTTVPVAKLDPPVGVAGEFLNDRAIVTWSPPADTEGLTGFSVFRDNALVADVGPGVVRWVDRTLPDLDPGATYRYRVRSNGPADGDPESSDFSAVAVVVIPDDPDEDPGRIDTP